MECNPRIGTMNIDKRLPINNDFYARMYVELDNGISFHCYHTYKRMSQQKGFILATTREVEDPTDEYERLEDVPDEVLDSMDFSPEFYSLRINTTPVVVDFSGTLLIPEYYHERLHPLNGEYRIRVVDQY